MNQQVAIDSGDTVVLTAPAALVPVKFSRFKDATWFGGKEDIIVVGAGGIGSHLTFLLSRAGFNCTVYDFDKVEEHNLGGQLFSKANIGISKLFALSNLVMSLGGEAINTVEERYTESSMTNKYMFSALDNMETRKIMFEKWQRVFTGSTDAIFIDGRLLFEQLTIFCIKGDDLLAQENYVTNYLFNDSEAKDELCSLKQTTHTATMIASMMVGFFTNFLTEIKSEDTVMHVPFKWEYVIPVGQIELIDKIT